MVVEIENLRDMAKQYANYHVEECGERYKNMGQINIHESCARGKFGECVVYANLILSGRPCTLPNFQRGVTKKWKFDADLTSGENRIHVKTVQSWILKKYGNCFLINPDDHLFDNWTHYDFFAVVLIDDFDKPTEQYSILKWVRVGDVINTARKCPDKPWKLQIFFD